MAQTYDQIRRQIGRVPKESIPPPLPPVGAYLYEWFWEIDQGWQAGGMGGGLYQELESWCRLSHIELNAWESATLIRMRQERVNGSRRRNDSNPQRPNKH